ncbi:accessory Sec system S-layer assembly protein [Peribacillus acanthi]|uniref:accessory Sec system S-layer assembly protein n=1 Tax=Peribacillus acanthi TaxID=2171554 RepID=UPI000D3E6E57|nr:accessory Sec system S-layer assembly protein [Peribacillus acanthi]
MLSIFRKKKDSMKRQGNDSVVSSNDLLQESNNQAIATDASIDTELSFHPTWEVPTEQMYVYRFLNNDLAPLKPNQISLSGIELRQEGESLVVVAFVRNSLDKGIKFNDVQLLLMDAEKKPIARHTFDMSVLGEIPGRSSRPWMFTFPAASVMQKEFSSKDWTLAFELKQKHRLDLHESWEEQLSSEDKEKLNKLVDSLEAPKEGEVNFMGVQAKLSDNGDLHATILIRNGSTKNIQLQQVPLKVIDATDEVVAQGGFQLELEVKANTSKPWTFIFPSSMITATPDLSKWKVVPIQN